MQLAGDRSDVAADRSYHPEPLSYPLYKGPGSPEQRDLQAAVLQGANGFKPDVSIIAAVNSPVRAN